MRQTGGGRSRFLKTKTFTNRLLDASRTPLCRDRDPNRERPKPRPRCIVLCTDGQQCGKRCHDGMSPPMCHVHRAIANGIPINQGHQFTSKARTPEEVVGLLMNSRDESIRLRAADLFLKRQEAQRACPKCSSQRESDRSREHAVHRMTHGQRTRLRALLNEVNAICEAASTQETTWDAEGMVPDIRTALDEREHESESVRT